MKMETPKMDVVRFQEADVIVASGDTKWYTTVANAGGADQNMSISIQAPGADSVYFDYKALQEGEHTLILENKTFTTSSGSASLYELIDDDDVGAVGSLASFNGLYWSLDGKNYQQ